jgi:hypothetical protein
MIPKSEGEHLADSLSRLESMRTDHGEHWDLSEKDEFAIGVVLSEIAALRASEAALAEKCKRLEGLLRRAAEFIGVEAWTVKDIAEDAALLREIRAALDAPGGEKP